MTKYTVASRRGARTEEKQVDPIWRGIGCVMIVVIPLMAYGIATLVEWLDEALAVLPRPQGLDRRPGARELGQVVVSALLALLLGMFFTQPTQRIANTIKGRGVSYIEGQAAFHNANITLDQFTRAMTELESNLHLHAAVQS